MADPTPTPDRAEFEAWALARWDAHTAPRLLDMDGGKYLYLGNEWAAWQAARAGAGARGDPWRHAVDVALVNAALDCTGENDNPAARVGELVAWTETVALDPAVSGAAAALVARGMEAAAVICDKRAETLAGLTPEDSVECEILANAIRAEARAMLSAAPPAEPQGAGQPGGQPGEDLRPAVDQTSTVRDAGTANG